ncbi:MAG: hypothetical protein LBK53_08995 [Heliobacteriaceae bacterium]|jgi:hypothetical protein|nr:hypothetical protein [Heliobacteriaceae bacterium]
MFFTNNYEFKNERLRTKMLEKPEPAAIRIPDNFLILTEQFWKQVQHDRMVVRQLMVFLLLLIMSLRGACTASDEAIQSKQ